MKMIKDWDMEYLDNLMPYERKIYLNLMQGYIKDQNDAIQKYQEKNGMPGIKVEHP